MCDAAPCRHCEEQQRLQRIREATAQAALAQTGRDALVVWLQPNEPLLQDLDDTERQAHRAFLEAVVAESRVIARDRLAGHTADDTHPQGAHLCGQCRGHCCRHGAAWQAFIDVALLQRWQRAHADAPPGAAIDYYVAALPDHHVQDSCLYQTERGCALPREHRADICNGFACAPLQQVQRSAAEAPQRPVLALTFDRDRVQRAAGITAEGITALELQAAADPGHMGR